MKVIEVPIDQVKPYENNPRINDDAVQETANSIKEFGWQQPIVVDKNNVVIVGHTRLKVAKKLKLKKVPVVIADTLSEQQVKAYRLADNKTGELADWDVELLDIELDDIVDFDMSDFGFYDMEDEQSTFRKVMAQDNDAPPLSERFGVFPGSILDTRRGEWQSRKKQWLDLGIASEVGREGNLTFAKSLDMGGATGGTSIFDPVLCELMYNWFTPHKNSKIYDPFAGGSVRGVTASILGHEYTGIDLRKEQVEANIENAKQIGVPKDITWINDDSLNVDDYIKDSSQDLLLTCPPYADLEVYSDDPQDISNMNEADFDKTYVEILKRGANKVKDNRFAVVVISDVRSKKDGHYRDLQGLTKKAFKEQGFIFYNDIVLVNVVGSGAIRARRNMINRKVVRCHQNVLVFYKGDTKQIKEQFPEIEVADDPLEESE